MSKRIVYRDEPIKIGRRVGREILPATAAPAPVRGDRFRGISP